MMNKKYLNLLGLANVAKGIVSGETLIKSIAANETKPVGKNNRVALGITNQGFAKKIKELIGG